MKDCYTVSSSTATTLKLPRLTVVSYAKWKPEAENCFKRAGMKGTDYKKEITAYADMKKYVEQLDERDAAAATAFMYAKLSGAATASSSSSTSASSSITGTTSTGGTSSTSGTSTTGGTQPAVDTQEQQHNKQIRGMMERSNRAYAVLYECLADDIRLLVNNNKLIVEGYGYSLWHWLETKYQSTEGDSIGKLWGDFTSVKQLDGESFEEYKARVDAIVQLLSAAEESPTPALYATILLDRLVARYNQIKMTVDSTSELGKNRKKIDWSVVTKFIQQQERNLLRQSEAGIDGNENVAQAMVAQGNSYGTKGRGSTMNSNRPSQGFSHLIPTAELPFRGKDGCWSCGLKSHSFRKCRKWLSKQGGAGARSAATSRSSSPIGKAREVHSAAAAATALGSPNQGRYAALGDEEQEADPEQPIAKITYAAAVHRVIGGNEAPKAVRFKDPMLDEKEEEYRKQAELAEVKANPRPILKVATAFSNAKAGEVSGLSSANWGIDSMASVHITGNRAHLRNLRRGPMIEVRAANDGKVYTDTIGDARIRMNCEDGESYIFTVPVYYHELFAANLLSAQKLREEEFDLFLGRKSASKGVFMITPDGKKVILSSKDDLTILECGQVKASVYLADIKDAAKSDAESAMAISGNLTNLAVLKTADDLYKLHCKLGHCAWTTLTRAIRKEQTEGLGEFQLSKAEARKALQAVVNCEVCIEAAGKCTEYGTRGLDHGTYPGEVLHMDTFYAKVGNHFEYGVVVRDPYSGVLLLNTHNFRDKDTVSTAVLDRIKFLETQLAIKVKRLYVDGGGEFVNDVLKGFCKEKGIALHWPPADKHQLNGSAESCVRIAKYGCRKMLRASGLPDQFWKYAAKHFAFVYNRISISQYTGHTPYESMMGKKPSCRHWGVFGCDVKYHIPKEKRPTTFSPTMISGIYLGHDPWRNCAEVYSMETKKLVFTRDVKYLNTFNYAKQLRQELESDAPRGDGEYFQIYEELKVGKPRENAPTGYPSDAEFDANTQDQEIRYEIEQIIGHRTRRGRKEYQVKWSGYPLEQSTWQGKNQLIEDGCKRTIDKYEAAIRGIELPDTEDEAEEPKNAGSDEESKNAPPAPASEESIEAEIDEDEAIKRAQVHAALCAFSAGYERSPTGNEDRRRRTELAMAVASGIALLEQQTPKSYKEAVRSKHAEQWKVSMQTEWDTLESEGVWEYVKRDTLPKGTNILPSRFVFKVKLKDNGEIEKFKSRLVAGGHRQKHGIDYDEVYASTGKYKTLRIMMSMAAKLGHDLHQMDVPAAYVKSPLKDTVYMEMPEGYREGREGEVLLLKKGLYGLHQAGRNWWLMVIKFLTKVLGFNQSVSDPSFFYKRTRSNNLMTMFLFVDDFQASTAPEDKAEWQEYLHQLKKAFNIKYLGEPSWLLGMKITRDRKRGWIKLDQELYITKALERFGFTECRTADTPEEVRSSKNGGQSESISSDELCDRNEYMEKVGTVIYAAISTRPDISHAVYQCSKKMQRPTKHDMKSVDRIFRYLAGTKKVGLIFGSRNRVDDSGANVTVCAYSDADWGNSEDRKSLSGWVVKINGDPISWSCKKQSVVAQSTCEAELYAEAAAINEVLWLKDLIGELGVKITNDVRLNIREDSGVIVYCDNQSTIKVSKNGIKADRTKHVDIKYHFITDVINEKKVTLKWVPTDRQEADIFTKALSTEVFVRLRRALMCEIELQQA